MWSRWTRWLAAVLLISACSHGTPTRVVRTDGTAVVGELIAARPDAVVVKLADGTTITIPRSVISAIESASTTAVASNTANASKDANRTASTKTGKPSGPTGQSGQSGQSSGTNAQAGGAPNAGGSAGTTATTGTTAGGSGNAARTGNSGSNAGAPAASSGKNTGATTTTAAKTSGQSGDPNGSAIAHDAVAPSGTTLELSLNTPIGSDTSAIDDKVDAVLRAPLMVNGEEILGAGALAHGVVTEATPSAKADGRGRLTVRFDALQLGVRTLPIQAAPVHWEASGVTKRAPQEAPHGLFGKIVSKTKKGLRIGDENSNAARGSAEVRFAPGATVRIRLEQAARIAP
jgi:hypothetical protein